MNLKKRVIEGGVIAVSLAILAATTSISGTQAEDKNVTTAIVQDKTVVEDTHYEVATIEKKSVDKVTATADSANETVSDSEESEVKEDIVSASVGVNAEVTNVAAQIDSADVVLVAEASETEEPKEEEAEASADDAEATDKKDKKNKKETKEAEKSVWDTRVMANVEESLNVRAAADENAELVGKLYRGAVAQVIEQGDAWTHIQSGNVDGYIRNDYCAYGTDAENMASSLCTSYATASAEGVRVRSEANTEAEIIDMFSTGDKLTVNKDAEVVDGWVAVSSKDGNGYVSADLVTVDMELPTAVTMEEEQARIAAEEAERKAKEEAAAREAAAKKAQEAAASAPASSGAVASQNAPASASCDETTLLAAVIQLEAGGECYEGKVAVGAVVMNRVRSGAYPNSISGVIYQSGQFSTAGGAASVAASGVSSSCLQAAQAAIGGADYTGGALSFRNVSSGIGGTVIGNHVFF